VAIITPSGIHYEHSLEIIEKYKKHVIIEKPTVLKPSQLINLNKLAESLGVKIFPVFQNRFNKAVQRVKKGINSGELGDIRVLSVRVRWCRGQSYYDLSPWRGTYSMDGGCITNQGIHHIDLIRYLAGEVEQVTAKMATLGSEIEVEDTMVGVIKFINGAIGSIEITTAARPKDFEASISIIGSKGLAQIGGIAVNELQIYTPDENSCASNSEDFSDCVYGNGHMVLYDEIAICLLESREFIINQKDNLKTIKLLNSFYLSDEQSKWINLNDNEESARLGREDIVLENLYKI
jgi:UDP-N-acetyl-2-amino-2-deoxyglucuronate dehydrogenase